MLCSIAGTLQGFWDFKPLNVFASTWELLANCMWLFSSWQALKRSTGNQGFQIWIDKLREWLKEQTYADNSLFLIENSSWDKLSSDQLPDDDVPIWIAAQRAVSRYEGILSPVGPRGRLLRRLLTWTGLIPSLPEATIKTDDETKHLEGHVRLDPKKMWLYLHLGTLYHVSVIVVVCAN